jgi:autotransporter-like protein
MLGWMKRYFLGLVFCIASAALYSDATTAYVTTNLGTFDVYRLDLTNGNASVVTTNKIDSGIALESSTLAYGTANVPEILYRLDITTAVSTQVATFPGGAGIDRLQLADSATAYVGGASDGNIYRANLTNGQLSSVTPNGTGINPTGIGLEMTLNSPSIAYVASTNGGVYQVNLMNGSVSQIALIPGADLRGLSLLNNTTAYVTDHVSNNVYRVDLTSGAVSFIASVPVPLGGGLEAIALANSTTAYAVDNSFNAYRVDLKSGISSIVNSSPIQLGLSDIALVLQIGTAGLHGNNLKFANYLNINAPQFTMPLIALQSDIPSALEIAAPTRNAIFTFAAQTTQISFGQVVTDHLGQKRWGKAWNRGEISSGQESGPVQSQLLFADASLTPPLGLQNPSPPSETTPKEIQDPATPSETAPLADIQDQAAPPESPTPLPHQPKSLFRYSPWIAGFGQYQREHKQRQTPSFNTGTGGFVLACDFFGASPELMLGSGVAYAHTHVHEDDGFGHATIDQGALMFYAAWEHRDYYFNMELWGSGYHAKNVRVINLPGVVPGSAVSSTNGWQLTPHLEVGYDYKDDWLCIEPFTVIDWVACWEQGFQEHGAGKLNMGQKGRFCSLLRNEWGLRFNETLSYEWGVLTFREKGSYAYQKAFHTGTLTAFLVGSPGSFVVSTLTGAQNLGVVELESLFVPFNKKYPYGTVSYQGEFGSRYQSHQGMASIGLDF